MTRATLQQIPSGTPGTRATLRVMSQLVRQYKKDIRIRELALSLTHYVTGHKDWCGQIRALHEFVRDNIMYVRDVRGVETVATPVKTLEYMQGDCDDQSVLLASLLESIGHPTRFVAIKLNGFDPYSHVFTETRVGNRWIPLETTENFKAGQPLRYSGKMVQHN